MENDKIYVIFDSYRGDNMHTIELLILVVGQRQTLQNEKTKTLKSMYWTSEGKGI